MMRVALATAGALVAASAVFVALVLPAEFGIDPSGIGRALGLTGLSGAEARRGHEPVAGALIVDQRDFELAPFESVELKYDLDAGRGIVYSWTASAEVVYDLHGEPVDAAPDYAESFAQGRAGGGQRRLPRGLQTASTAGSGRIAALCRSRCGCASLASRTARRCSAMGFRSSCRWPSPLE